MMVLKNNKNIDKKINYWKAVDEVPNEILDFISKKSKLNTIFDYENRIIYCPKCFDNDYSCSRSDCRLNLSTYKYNVSDNKNNPYENHFYYYVFQIVNNQVLLYKFKEFIYIHNSNSFKPYKTSKLIIDSVFNIQTKGILELLSNKYYSYKEYIKSCKYICEALRTDIYDNDELEDVYNIFTSNCGWVYLNNLEELKNTIYKNSQIWTSIKYLDNNEVNLDTLVHVALNDKEFEHLMKYKLYNLAYNGRDFKVEKTFEKTFGLSEDYLDFMVQNDIENSELLVLQLVKIKDIKLIRKLSNWCYILKYLHEKYKIDIFKLKKYFDEHNLDYNYLVKYNKYIEESNKCKLNINDEKILFPENLLEVYNKISI